jgi:hypothetical protein
MILWRAMMRVVGMVVVLRRWRLGRVGVMDPRRTRGRRSLVDVSLGLLRGHSLRPGLIFSLHFRPVVRLDLGQVACGGLRLGLMDGAGLGSVLRTDRSPVLGVNLVPMRDHVLSLGFARGLGLLLS